MEVYVLVVVPPVSFPEGLFEFGDEVLEEDVVDVRYQKIVQ